MTKPTWRIPDASLDAVLSNYCQDLTAVAPQNRKAISPEFEEEIQEVLCSLSRKDTRSICFTGEAGSGKSTMISCVAQYIAEGKNLPPSLQGTRVLQLNLNAMCAGAQILGQFEERMKPLVDGLQERQGIFKGNRIVLASDDVSLLFNADNFSAAAK